MTVSDAFKEFLLSRKYSGLLAKTIDSYKNLIHRFVDFIGADTDMSCITDDDLKRYLASLYDLNLSRSSIASYIRNPRIFLKWYAFEYGKDIQYRFSILKVPKTPKKAVHLYTPEEIKLIFDSVKISPEWLTFRNWAMIALMLDSGIRQSEVAGLRRDCIYFSENNFKVFGKGQKERIVPLGELSTKYLKQYFSICPFDSDYAFLSLHGEPISCDAIKSMTWDLQRNLPFPFSSHLLRHNFATNYLIDQYEESGQMDIYKLAAIMGHEDFKTTMKYLHEAKQLVACSGYNSHLDKVLPAVM